MGPKQKQWSIGEKKSPFQKRGLGGGGRRPVRSIRGGGGSINARWEISVPLNVRGGIGCTSRKDEGGESWGI